MADDELVSTFEVRTRVSGDDDPFYGKENIRRLESESLDAWKAMTLEERSALVIILRDALIHLMADAEAWLPASLVVESNQRIQVVLTFQTRNIAEITATMRRKGEENKAVLRDEIVDMRRELGRVED